jgi:hypothetical protein
MNFKTITIVRGKDNYRFDKRRLSFAEKAARNQGQRIKNYKNRQLLTIWLVGC